MKRSTPSSTERGRHTVPPQKSSISVSSCIKDKMERKDSFRNVSVDHIKVLVIWNQTHSVFKVFFFYYFAQVFEYKGFNKICLTLSKIHTTKFSIFIWPNILVLTIAHSWLNANYLLHHQMIHKSYCRLFSEDYVHTSIWSDIGSHVPHYPSFLKRNK